MRLCPTLHMSMITINRIISKYSNALHFIPSFHPGQATPGFTVFSNGTAQLSCRMPENLGFQRAAVTEEVIRQWFIRLEEFLKEEHYIDAQDFLCEENAGRIYNLDESGFPLQGTNSKLKVIGERGAKNVYKLAPESKTQITVLACISAGGNYSKPYVIFPAKNLPRYNFTGVDENDFDVGFTANG